MRACLRHEPPCDRIGKPDQNHWSNTDAAALRLSPIDEALDRCFSCLFALSAAAQAPLDVRLALVIGNSAYANSPLPNPVNDAKAMGETLRGLGFGVIELQDASKAQMAEAIARIRDQLKGEQAMGAKDSLGIHESRR